jgi:hypothetical protein
MLAQGKTLPAETTEKFKEKILGRSNGTREKKERSRPKPRN